MRSHLARPAALGQASANPGRDLKRRPQRLSRHLSTIIAGAILLFVVVCASAAPVIAPFDPTKQNIMMRLSPLFTRDGGKINLLGTDQLGRDVLSRIVYGGRVSLVVSALGVVGSGTIGVSLGLWAGYARGIVDSLVMRLVELQLAFPVIVLALALIGLLGPTAKNIVIVFVVTSWSVYARTVRTSVLAVRSQEYIEAARALGNSDIRILLRHIFPNALSPLIVIASFETARLVILEASLGFLGLGIQPPVPTWGNMLAEGRDYLGQGWWIAAFSGMAIAMTVGSVNLLGDALRDRLDPHLRNE